MTGRENDFAAWRQAGLLGGGLEAGKREEQRAVEARSRSEGSRSGADWPSGENKD